MAGKAAGQTRSSGRTAIWPPYIRASLALAATAGFSLGAALFAASTLGFPLGPWWPAAAQAHGHVQRFGWAGLMVLGVGLHFLPRLRGTTLERPERAVCPRAPRHRAGDARAKPTVARAGQLGAADRRSVRGPGSVPSCPSFSPPSPPTGWRPP